LKMRIETDRPNTANQPKCDLVHLLLT